MKPEIFKVGDRIFTASSIWTSQPKLCPVCEGTTRILVKAPGAPDERGTEMSCEYCRWAERDGLKRGHVVEDWAWAPRVNEIVIEGIERIDKPGKKEIKYLYLCSSCSHYSVRHEDVYTTRDEATAAANAITRTAENTPKPGAKQNPSYSIGYCRSQIKKAEAEAERWRNCMQNKP